MGSATTRQPARRWTVQLRATHRGLVLSCPQCGTRPLPTGAGRHSAVLAHLAQHVRDSPLAAYLRTCQCGAQNCPWHPRQRGCDGSILLILTRNRAGSIWRLADLCQACATSTSHSAVVPEPDPLDFLQTNPSPHQPAPSNEGVELLEEHGWWVEGAGF